MTGYGQAQHQAAERWVAEHGHAYEPGDEVDPAIGTRPRRRCGRFAGSALHQGADR